jgi:hypothetical protein
MQKLATLSLAGLFVGIFLVVWVQPATAGGAGFVVFVSILLVNGVGGLVGFVMRPPPAAQESPKRRPRVLRSSRRDAAP